MTLNAQDLDSHQWENRILIVHTTNRNNIDFKKQLKIFKDDQIGLIERKLVLYKIINNQFELTNFKDSNPIESGDISKRFENKYVKHKNDFTIMLLGLDGSIKLQKQKIVSIDELFSLIDSMPMRRREMKRNN